MWNRFTRHVINAPRAHTTSMGYTALPHCILSVAKYSRAISSITAIPKFEGFQRCLPFHRMTYFDVIAMALVSANGHHSGERIRMPTLMPVMYALARIGRFL